MKNWEGEYQVVRWGVVLNVEVAKAAKEQGLDPRGNASPIPMRYAPKLDAVFDGRCTQTIRKSCKFEAGQRRWVFEWSGKPYRSKWGRRMLVEIVSVGRVEMGEHAMCFKWADGRDLLRCTWESTQADILAVKDHIDPPTGVALRNVLKGLNK